MEVTNDNTSHCFTIDGLLVNPQLNTISSHGSSTRIEPQVMQVLLCLARFPGDVLTRDYLINEVWKGVVPNDEGLSQAIWKLRTALGDSSKDSRIIQTVRKKGYRLIMPVIRVESQKEIQVTNPVLLENRAWKSAKWGVALFVCCVSLYVLFTSIPTEEPFTPIEERQFTIAGSDDTLSITMKVLSDNGYGSVPDDYIDSLLVDALIDIRNQQSKMDSLGLKDKINKVSIKRSLPIK